VKFCTVIKTQQIFHLTQNMIKAFKFRAQAIFSLLENTHPPGSQNLSSRNFFHYSKFPVSLGGISCNFLRRCDKMMLASEWTT
jgi:hypothetical protein